MRFLLALILCAGWLQNAAAHLPLDVTGTLPMPSVKHRVYVGDVAINHIVDGRVHVLDGDTGKYLGMISTGFAGQFTLSPDKRLMYVATTYLSRLQRGERVDLVEVYDTAQLKFKHEILIEPRRAQGLGYKGYVRTSSDGRLLYVLNATPAVTVSVVDLELRKQVAEIDAAGCWGIYPAASHARRFGMLCGDGTVASFTLAEDGQLLAQGGRANSATLFDPDKDALFIQAEQDEDVYWFVSFTGQLAAIDMGQASAISKTHWALSALPQTKQGKVIGIGAGNKPAKGGAHKIGNSSGKTTDHSTGMNWRPGGYGPLALDAQRGRIFVGMHSGGKEGSHKQAASQIWVFDIKSKTRIARLPGEASIAMHVPAGTDQPMLYLIDGVKNGLIVRAGPRYLVKHRVTPIGDAAVLLDSQ